MRISDARAISEEIGLEPRSLAAVRDLGLGVFEYRRQLEAVQRALAADPGMSARLDAMGVPAFLANIGAFLDAAERFCHVYDEIALDTHEDFMMSSIGHG